MNIIHLLYMDNIYNNINKLYKKGGFLERYGSDLLVTIMVLLIFFIIFSYYLIMNNIEPIRANWAAERCSPAVIPFAGLINAPPGVSKLEFTKENFNGCLNSILKSMVAYSLAPIYYIIHVIIETFKGLFESINSMRELMNSLRTNVASVTDNIHNRSVNVTTPIIQLLINVKDMLSKTQGVLTAGIFSLFGGYLSMKTVLNSIVDMMTVIIISLVSFVIFLWILPMTWGLAIPLTALTGTLIGIVSYISVNSQSILKISPKQGLPGKPRCFDENTKIKLFDNTIKFIKDLDIGDKLIDGTLITGMMISSTSDHTFYNLNGIIVTGTHRVYHKEKGWILVKEHPDSIYIEHYNKPLMYCVGTDTKLFTIDDIIFGDWDELDHYNLIELYTNAKHTLPRSFMRKHVHEYLDGGFIKGTQIELKNGKFVNIEDIKIGDELKHGEYVLTTVKLDSKDLIGVYEYHIGDTIIKGGPNLEIMDKNLGTIDTTKLMGIKIAGYCDYIYHLVTDKETLYVNGIRFCDYNSTTDKYLEDRKMKSE